MPLPKLPRFLPLFAALVAAALVLYRLFVRLRALSPEDVVSSPVFAAWKGALERVQALLPAYRPLDADGRPQATLPGTPFSAAPPLGFTGQGAAGRQGAAAGLPRGLPRSAGEALHRRPLQLRGVNLRNRVIRAAAFDGER